MPIDLIDQLAFNSSIPLVSAFFIGVATSIAPCAFASNVAAISYISRNLGNPKRSLTYGILFTAGRMLTYVAIGAMMISAGRVIGDFARGTQTYGNLLMGPLLLIIGFIFMGILNLNFNTGSGAVSKAAAWFKDRGGIGAFVMGMIFAFAFCPYSGLLFFGLLIPLALGTSYGYALPAAFGVGISIPVLMFVGLLYVSVSRARNYGRIMNRSWPLISKALGAVLVILGSYYLSPYITARYGISYVFELLSVFLLSFAGLLLIRSFKASSSDKSPDVVRSRDMGLRETGPARKPPVRATDGIPRGPYEVKSSKYD
ncbi:MAG: sulfite exporter TauE/SafE family protein [Candidatus Methanofastidiosa archaeon]|nr:sulfite exporter TauE/SafE family protein [Candidatus Methanofastidiosa archaeon]